MWMRVCGGGVGGVNKVTLLRIFLGSTTSMYYTSGYIYYRRSPRGQQFGRWFVLFSFAFFRTPP